MTGATAITMWKCATTKSVSDSGILTVALPRKSPVIPPLIKNSRNAIENSIGMVRWIFPCQSVSTQL